MISTIMALKPLKGMVEHALEIRNRVMPSARKSELVLKELKHVVIIHVCCCANRILLWHKSLR